MHVLYATLFILQNVRKMAIMEAELFSAFRQEESNGEQARERNCGPTEERFHLFHTPRKSRLPPSLQQNEPKLDNYKNNLLFMDV
jgi:hypothetical protein